MVKRANLKALDPFLVRSQPLSTLIKAKIVSSEQCVLIRTQGKGLGLSFLTTTKRHKATSPPNPGKRGTKGESRTRILK